MENLLKFTYRAGKPVRNHGKVILLDKHRKWSLAEGFEYIIENPTLLELEKCIIVKSATFVRIDDIPPTYEVSGGPYVHTEDEEHKLNFSVRKVVKYQEKIISFVMDNENFTFDLTGGEEFYDPLPTEAQKQVNEFRVWMTWISEKRLSVLDSSSDFLSHRGYRLWSEIESHKVQKSGLGSPEQPKEVSVLKLQTLIYQAVYQQGFEPVEAEEPKEVLKTIKKLSLDESDLPFSFRPVWKSPTLMVGRLTVNGEEIEGLTKRPGDGTGSYLDAVMYLGLMEVPSNLTDDDRSWLESGGKVCWVYCLFRDNITKELIDKSSTQPTQPHGWVKINIVCSSGYGAVRYIKDSFNNQDYHNLIELY